MSDSRPIGLFDSGIGGLTVLKALSTALPKENYIYFGDTARTPYGNKSTAAVTQYALQITSFLLKQNVKALIVACNTVSAVAIKQIRELAGEIPVFEVISPLVDDVSRFLKGRPRSRVGVLATRRTVASRQYPEAIRERADGRVQVEQIACPLFVNLVEEGIWEDLLAEAAVDHYLRIWKEDTPDAVLLGCTHYPLLKPLIEAYLPDTAVLESGPALSRAVAEALTKADLKNEGAVGSRVFYCTDTLDSFVDAAAIFLGDATENITQINWKDVGCT